MSKYEVTLKRTMMSWQKATVIVEAKSEDDAIEKAFDSADGHYIEVDSEERGSGWDEVKLIKERA